VATSKLGLIYIDGKTNHDQWKSIETSSVLPRKFIKIYPDGKGNGQI
jgi:hypothetical protein